MKEAFAVSARFVDYREVYPHGISFNQFLSVTGLDKLAILNCLERIGITEDYTVDNGFIRFRREEDADLFYLAF